MYRLKPGQESIEIVDGPGAGLKFLRGKVYDSKIIPKTETWRFEPVPKPAEKKAPAPGMAADKQAAESKKAAGTGKKEK